jgi:hypothetical protein
VSFSLWLFDPVGSGLFLATNIEMQQLARSTAVDVAMIVLSPSPLVDETLCRMLQSEIIFNSYHHRAALRWNGIVTDRVGQKPDFKAKLARAAFT